MLFYKTQTVVQSITLHQSVEAHAAVQPVAVESLGIRKKLSKVMHYKRLNSHACIRSRHLRSLLPAMLCMSSRHNAKLLMPFMGVPFLVFVFVLILVTVYAVSIAGFHAIIGISYSIYLYIFYVF